MRPNTPAPMTRMGEDFDGGVGGEDIFFFEGWYKAWVFI